MKDEIHPSAFLLHPCFLGSGSAAAFVALTVAGQQGNFLPPPFSPPNFGFWIADFGLGAQSKIQNLKSKMGAEMEWRGVTPFPYIRLQSIIVLAIPP